MEFGPIFRALTRNRARFFLIVAEVALTLAIVANCATLILSARAEISRPSGFDDEALLAVSTTPFAEHLAVEEAKAQRVAADLAGLSAIPGVESASNTNFLPWRGGGTTMALQRPGSGQSRNPDDEIGAQFYSADPALAETLGVSLVGGRTFTEEENQVDTSVFVLQRTTPILISRVLAERLFPEGAALGKTVQPGEGSGEGEFTIVGIFDRFYNPMGESSEVVVIFPGRSDMMGAGMDYLVRVEPGKSSAVAREVEAFLLRAETGRNVRVRTIPEMRGQYHSQDRLLVASLNGVMALLVLVTSLGIVGLTAFSVAERRRQIGTRRALGATQGAILRYFLLENWMVTSLGALLGIALAIGLNVGLVNFTDAARLEWQVVAAGVFLLWTIGLGAALGPALRGARIAPAIATRNV